MKFKDQTGFEIYLESQGFKAVGNYDSDYYNTYNHCSRRYDKGDKSIFFGLMDRPTRIGITHPIVYKVSEDSTRYEPNFKYTYLPEPNQYKEYLDALT